MRIAMVVSEMEPLAKTGGLADVAAALPGALGRLGARVELFLPRYACIQERDSEIAFTKGVTVHLIDHPGHFHRPGLYGDGNGDYPDNLDRFSFFCRQALKAMEEKGIRPDILHAHDWQSALSVVYLALKAKEDPHWAQVKTVMTVHNLAYQGIFPKEQYPKLEIPWEHFTIHGLEFYDRINLLKGGLLFARQLTTVSPSYAREIQTPETGERLDGVFRMRSQDLVGILNGIDVKVWNPATDPHLVRRYGVGNVKSGKARNKIELQKEFGLPADPKIFLIGMVSRLASQKGLDLVVQACHSLSSLGIQLVILGKGDLGIEETLTAATKHLPFVRVRLAFDDPLAHRIYAGSDAFLMPSRYEPCGLGQMIAMRYGTVPIVRTTGGLADTVTEADPSGESGNGFTFSSYEPEALVEAIGKAARFFKEPSTWQRLMTRGMSTDFSWDRSAQEYLRLYESLKRGL